MLRLTETGFCMVMVNIGAFCIGVLSLTTDANGRRRYEAFADGQSYGVYDRQRDAIDALMRATF